MKLREFKFNELKNPFSPVNLCVKDEKRIYEKCSIGDTVYRIQYVQKENGRYRMGVAEFKFTLLCLYEMGKRIFLTREEAEKALEKMK